MSARRSTLTPEQWEVLKDLFNRALDLPESERSVWLRTVEGIPEEIRAEAERLLGNLAESQRLDPTLLFAEGGPDADSPQLSVGERLLGRFEVLGFVGRGGMGEVYSALDHEIGARVALKTVTPVYSRRPELLRQLHREIRLARKIHHQNVCQVFDLHRVERADGSDTVFLSMELIEGETLQERLRRGPLDIRDLDLLTHQLVAALDAIHAEGVVHRDLKTGNVMLARGSGFRAVVLDFGLSRDAVRGPTDSQSLFGPGAVLGTPSYMAPEQLRGEPATERSDLYALGTVLFEAATGVPPFEGETPLAVALRRLQEEPPSPRRYTPQLSEVWANAILACLAADPSERPPSAQALSDLLAAKPPSRYRRASRWTRRHWLAVAAGLGGAGAVTITALRPGRPSVSHDAITHFKRGEEFSRRRTEEGLRNALEEYNTAVRLEPGYSLAWAGLADAYSSMSNFGIMDQQQALGLGREAAVRAVQLDSRSARAQGVLGYVTSLDFDRWRTAEPYFRAAINLDPADEDTRLWYGAYLGKLGRFDDAIAQLKSGLDQSPSSFVLNHQLAMEYFLSRRFTDLERQARDLVRLHPYDASSHLTLARALEWRGRYEEALESCSLAAKYSDSMSALCFRGSVEAAMGNLAEANRIAARVEQYWVGHSFETVLLVALWCRIGNYAKALACLEEGYRRRDNSILAAQVNPYLDPLREQPRYKSVIRSLGLTP